MTNASSQLSPRVEIVLNAIAGWITRYRQAHATHRDLAACDKHEVKRIADELGLSIQQLETLSSKSSKSAVLLEQMLTALGVDAEAHKDVAVLRDLQRLCVSCGERQRCLHEFDVGGAAKHFHEYCPNAYTLDALLAAKNGKTKVA
jgi:hypothetical protein